MYCISIASVQITFISRPNAINCPGDKLSYNCLIQSNSESLHLTWRITTPGSTPVTIDVNSTFIDSIDTYDITLDNYEQDALIESTVDLTVGTDNSLELTLLECSIGELSNTSIVVFLNMSGNYVIHSFESIPLCSSYSHKSHEGDNIILAPS